MKGHIYTTFTLSFQLLVFKFANFFGILWGFVGASIVGSNGICVNYGEAPDEEKDVYANACYYNVNLAENRSIAIVSVILHVFGCIIHLILGVTDGETNYASIRPSLHLKTAHKSVVPKPRGNEEDPNISSSKYKTKQDPLLHLARLKPTSEETAKKLHTLRRHTSLFDVERTKHDLAMKRGTTNVVSPPPHPPTMKDGKAPRLPSLTPRSGDEKMTGYEIRLSERISANDLLKGRTKSKSKHALKQRASYIVSSFKHKHGDRPPPPAYEETVNTDGRQYPVYVGPSPYILPPPPLHDPRDLTAPENMYTGSSYPETDLIAKKPSDFHHERY
mgnify:CR=1 FL=1